MDGWMEGWKNERRTPGSLQSDAEWRKLNAAAHHGCTVLLLLMFKGVSCWSTPEMVCYETARKKLVKAAGDKYFSISVILF